MDIIRNIIFDFGGVIYNIDFNQSKVEFQKLGLEHFDVLYSKLLKIKIFDRLETNDISPFEFRMEIRKWLNGFKNDEQIDNAWNALLLGFDKRCLKLLQSLKLNYNIYLLSNTNQIHYKIFFEEFKQLTSYQSFDELFVKSYFSFEMNYRKPDIEAYLYVLKDAKLNASETLFVDDSEQNIQTASKAGMQTYFLDLSKGQHLSDLFTNSRLKNNMF